MAQNPFQTDPFGDAPPADPVRRIRSAVGRIRNLKGQVGHDGFTPSAARSLIDELTAALTACAGALEALDEDRGS